jgi:lysozyme
MGYFINGIDVSRWQGVNINWQTVKSEGYLFSFIKATDGSAYKRQFIEMEIKQANDAKKAGLKIGYYHFAHPNDFGGIERDAQDEAYYFLKTLGEFPKPNFPLVLDLEDQNILINSEDTEKWIGIFQKIIKNEGFDLIMYSYKGYLDKHLPSTHNFGNLPLWIASYPRIFDINKPPKNPTGWDSWAVWQFSDKGNVNGITESSVDLNVMKEEFFNNY